jgi:hypothetical protein
MSEQIDNISNQVIDLLGLNFVVHLIDGVFILLLVNSHINSKHQCFVIPNLLHGQFGGE